MSDLKSRKWLKSVIQGLFFIAIIAGGLLFAKHFMDTKPVAKRSRPVRQTPLVETLPMQTTTRTVSVNAMGTVISSREITLYPELAGTVAWVSPDFVPGGKISKGNVLLRLDTTDFELEVKKQQSLIQQLQADLDLEKGQQEVARKEMELMQKTLRRKIKDPKLALRVPQMKKVLASLKSQQINLEQALINLERTTVRAPFNAMILDRNIELGSRISTQSSLATITARDKFWIEAAVPVDKLRWIRIPDISQSKPSMVTVHLQDGSTASGTVIRLLGDLTDKSQMARILVQVDDPLSTGKRSGRIPLLLNSYVSLDITGTTIEEVIAVPRSAVKDGNQVWILEAGRLDIRSIVPVWEDKSNVYVKNSVKAGELLITSSLSTAVDGMAVRSLSTGTGATKVADNRKKGPIDGGIGRQSQPNREQVKVQ